MTKTIEELSKQYAENMCPIEDYSGGMYDEQRHSDLLIYTDDARSVLSWLFSQPLASRMTKEEKERVRMIYVAARDGYWDECNDMNIAVESVLEDIFGKELFREGEGC